MLVETRKLAMKLFQLLAVGFVCFHRIIEVIPPHNLAIENDFGAPLQAALKFPDSLKATAIGLLHSLIAYLLSSVTNTQVASHIVEWIAIYVIAFALVSFFQSKNESMKVYDLSWGEIRATWP